MGLTVFQFLSAVDLYYLQLVQELLFERISLVVRLIVLYGGNAGLKWIRFTKIY